MAGGSFDNAKQNKEDEFYTTFEAIQKELNNYTKHFKNKTVLCNCDDPYESNFCYFFLKNFNYLGLKRLIATSYASSPVIGKQLSLFDDVDEEVIPGNGYVIDIKQVPMANGRGITDDDIAKLLTSSPNGVKKLQGDGDFKSNECINYLKEADIVVTNPPFSLFRTFVSYLMKYKKKFLIIGSQNAITYKDIFNYLKQNKMWLGYQHGNMNFRVPDSYLPRKTRFWVDESGQKWRSLGNICWFTNLDIEKRHEEMVLYKQYNALDNPKYVNYDGINVGKTKEIPINYPGVMGVPITFMNSYNPKQFKIIGLGIVGSCNFINNRKMEILNKEGQGTGKFTNNAKGTLYLKYRQGVDKKGPAFKDVETGELYSSLFARILIKNINPKGSN